MVVAMILWLLVLVVVSCLVETLFARIFRGRTFRYVLAPGVMVHELSHVLACFLVGASVERVCLFGEAGGCVEHGKPKLPVLGQFVISFAPVAGCLFVMWGVATLLVGNLHPKWSLPVSLRAEQFVDGVAAVSKSFWSAISSADLRSVRTLAFAYLFFSFGLATAPSKEDLKHAVGGILVFGVVWAAVAWFTMHASPLDGTLPLWAGSLWRALSLEIVALVAGLIVATPVAFVLGFGRTWQNRKARG